MNKEQVYVPLLTPDDCKRAYEILSKAGEKVTLLTGDALFHENLSETINILSMAKNGYWVLHEKEHLKPEDVEITLDQLSEMLCGEGNKKTENEKEEIVTKVFVDIMCEYSIKKEGPIYTLPLLYMGTAAKKIFKFMSGYHYSEMSKLMNKLKEADQQTLELRKELTDYSELMERMANQLNQCSIESEASGHRVLSNVIKEILTDFKNLKG